MFENIDILVQPDFLTQLFVGERSEEDFIDLVLPGTELFYSDGFINQVQKLNGMVARVSAWSTQYTSPLPSLPSCQEPEHSVSARFQ